MKVETRLCWAEFALPLVFQNLDFVNIGDVEGVDYQDNLDFLNIGGVEGLADQDQLDFQHLSVNTHAAWIAQALGFPQAWWRKYQTRILFLNEILLEIKNLKSEKRKLPNAVVAIEVRGRQALLQTLIAT